jgi:predicted nucleic acid-binding Zn ribbon protein
VCGYRIDPGRCPECGKVVDSGDLVCSEHSARLNRWERRPLLAKLLLTSVVLPLFLVTLLRGRKVPSGMLVDRKPLRTLIAYALLASGLSLFIRIQDVEHVVGVIWGLPHRPCFIMAATSSALLCVIYLVVKRARRRLIWRAAVYGLSVFSVVQTLWLVWMSIAPFGLVSVGDQSAAHSGYIQLPSADTSVCREQLLVLSLLAPFAYGPLLLVVLPLRVLAVKRATTSIPNTGG